MRKRRRMPRRWASVLVPVALGATVALGVGACGTEPAAPPSTDPGPSGTSIADTTRPPATTVPAAVGPLEVGSSADLPDLRVTVVRADVGDQTNRGLARGRFLLVSVRLQAAGEGIDYGPRDWSLETTDGEIPPFALAEDDRLGFGELTAGGVEEGRVVFDLGTTTGSAQLRYRSPAGTARWIVELGGGVPPGAAAPPVSSAP